MADNTELDAMTGGDVIASDDISGVKFQRVKIAVGADGVNDGDVSFTNPLPIRSGDLLSTSNSSSTPLAGDATFTGSWVTTEGFAQTTVMVTADQLSATNGIVIQHSSDGTNVDYVSSRTLDTTSEGRIVTIPTRGKYVRVLYTNGSTIQTVFRLQTYQRVMPSSGAIVELDHSVGNHVSALVTKAQIIGKTTAGGGSFVDVKVNPSGALTTETTLAANSGVDVGDVTINNASGASAVNIQDGGNTITVDGTVTANAGTGPFPVSDNGGSLTVDGTVIVGDGTQAIDIDVAPTDGEVNGGKRLLHTESWLWGYNGSTWDRLRSDTTNGLDVDVTRVSGNVTVVDGGGALTVDGTVTAAVGTGATDLGKAEDAGHTSGDVGVMMLGVRNSTHASRTNADGDYTPIAVDAEGCVLVVGNVAHDAQDADPPIKIGGRADTTYQAAVADGDRVDALFDVYGHMFVRTDHARTWNYKDATSNQLTDSSVQGAPGTGLSVYITDIVFSSGAATAVNVFLEEGATTILGPFYLEAVAGRGLAIHFQTPYKCTANTAVTVSTSAAVAHGLNINGFIAP